MPAPVGQTTPLLELLQPLPRREGKKQPADPFRVQPEVTAPDSERAPATGTASPVDPMSMETFLTLMELGSPASTGQGSEAAPVPPRPPAQGETPAFGEAGHTPVKPPDLAGGGVAAG